MKIESIVLKDKEKGEIKRRNFENMEGHRGSDKIKRKVPESERRREIREAVSWSRS